LADDLAVFLSFDLDGMGTLGGEQLMRTKGASADAQ
jgi:hypothetical protein